MFGLHSPLLWRSLRSSASSFLSQLSARTLSGWWSERTSYSRVHSNGGFEETIEAAKAAWTRIKKNTALTFEDWLCISMALVIGQAAAMAASQMNRPYRPRDHAAINEWLNANDLWLSFHAALRVANHRHSHVVSRQICCRPRRHLGCPTFCKTDDGQFGHFPRLCTWISIHSYGLFFAVGHILLTEAKNHHPLVPLPDLGKPY
jgi:hypothetical protein